MLRDKIMILAIGILSFGGVAGAQSVQTDSGPAELPPANFKGKQYVDSKGCVYIKAGYGSRITWVPRVNRKRQVYCSSQNKPSLSTAQLAVIREEPVKTTTKATPATAKQPVRTMVVKTPVKPAPIATTAVKSATAIVAVTPRKTPANSGTRSNTLPPHPADVIRAENGVYTPPAGAPVNSVRGTSAYERRINRDAIRSGPQAEHPADVIRAEKAGRSSHLTIPGRSTPIVPNRVDPIHRISIYRVVIGSDITPRGDAQMALIWTNTVPRRLIRKERARQVSYYASTKSP